MSEKLSRLEEKKLRRWIRRILVEDGGNEKALLTEDWDDFWGPSVDSNDFMKTFVTPFTDVLKVAQVATKDLLSVATLNLELLFNFKSPEKAEEALNRYSSRKEKIQSEYAEVMKSTEEALQGDASLIMFALNPGATLARGFPQGVRDTASFLSDAGFNTGILPKTEKQKRDEGGDEPGPIRGALKDLAKIFFLAHHKIDGPVLSEGGDDAKPAKSKDAPKDQPKEAKSKDPVKEINAHFEEMGLAPTLKKMAADVLSAKEEQLEVLIPVIQSQGAIIKALAGAETLEDFKSAAAESGGAVESVGELEKMVKDEAQKMLENPDTREEMVKKYAEKEGVKPEKDPETGKEKYPEVEDEKLLPDMEVIVFADTKKGLQEQLQDGQTKLKKEAIAAVNDDNLTDADLKLLDDTPDGKKYADMLRAAVKQINEA